MNALLPFLLAALAVASFAGTHAGVLVAIGTGFLMDPVRKLVPDQPVWLTGVVAACAGLVMVGSIARREPNAFEGFVRSSPAVRAPLVVGAVWVAIESLRGWAISESGTVALIGVLSYALPVAALVAGYAATRSMEDQRRILLVYAISALAMSLTVVLSAAGLPSELFRQIGEGSRIYNPRGGAVELHAGFFRGAELAGWHAAAGFAATLFLATWPGGKRLAVPVTAAALGAFAAAVVLTGRRKYALQVVLFVGLWWLVAAAMRRSGVIGRTALVFAVLAVAVFAFVDWTALVGDVPDLATYFYRLKHVKGETGDRVDNLGLLALEHVYAQNGFLGSGAGTGSQGSQYFGGGSRITGFSAESGIGKVLAELGVPGLMLVLWLAVALAVSARGALRALRERGSPFADAGLGIAAFLASNVAVFSLAHQIFGDPFVLCMLGFLTGSLLRSPEVAGALDVAPLPPVLAEGRLPSPSVRTP